MKYKGITYDAGVEYTPNVISRRNLSADVIDRDMNAIKNELHCNSVRIYGTGTANLLSSAEIAFKNGLNVWLSPRMINGDIEDTLSYLIYIAGKFEKLRKQYPVLDAILIIGCELSIDMKSFVEGDTIYKRIANITKPVMFIKKALGFKYKFQRSFDKFISDAVKTVRNEFKGKITYASAMWESVEWKEFDFVGVNLYKASFNKAFFNRMLKKNLGYEKPLIITEFGCCTYDGADLKGPTGYFILDMSKNPPAFKEKCIRNESIQSAYILDLLNTYEQAKVEGAFVFDFIDQGKQYNDNPDLDFDKACFAVTKYVGNNNWEPKESFYKIAEYYGRR